MFEVCNWLLTRKCNLRCEYCGLVRDSVYGKYSDFIKKEKGYKFYIDTLTKIKSINENAFHIFYGGEPMLYDDLDKIIDFCNKNDINYTLITNGTLFDKIENLFNKVGIVKGLTCSADPLMTEGSDRDIKTQDGLKLFKWVKDNYGDKCDVVAEITMDATNYQGVPALVDSLESINVWSSITCYDEAKTEFYDFSNRGIGNVQKYLLNKNDKIKNIFDILKTKRLVHFPPLLDILYETLPGDYECNKLENPFDNITIDSDGAIRLCLRIRGNNISHFHIDDLFKANDEYLKYLIKADFGQLCQGCNWTCPMMSELVNKNPDNLKLLLHNE